MLGVKCRVSDCWGARGRGVDSQSDLRFVLGGEGKGVWEGGLGYRVIGSRIEV